MHFIRLYKTKNPGSEEELSFTECLSVKSVLNQYQPDSILIHTNIPKFWPLSSCQTLIENTSLIHLVHHDLHEVFHGQKISVIHHQADLAKLLVLRDYGGIVMDFDVFFIQPKKIDEYLEKFDCVVCSEGSLKKFNAGFSACRKNSSWSKKLIETYENDYRSGWVYNSGENPNKVRCQKDQIWILFRFNV